MASEGTGQDDGVALGADPAGLWVEFDHAHAARSTGTGYDVCIDGHRTWSIRLGPSEAVASEDGERHELAWPPELRRRLSGHALLSLRASGQDAELASATVDFGGAHARPDLYDESGRWLSVNKWGRLGVAFDGRPLEVRARMLDEVERLVEVCRSQLDIDVFVTYGTLLGAVRAGRVLAHDDDADLAYLSAATNPADLALESFANERALSGAGYDVVRHSAGHLQVVCRRDHAVDFHIDLFTCFVIGESFYEAFAVCAPRDAVKILPLGTVELDGRTLPAPAEPESLLVATYGPDWRTPDPAFRFDTPGPARRRFTNWLGALHGARDSWDELYTAGAADTPGGPSEFARSVAGGLAPGAAVLDVGAGRGADARFLAASGHPVRAIDFSAAAVRAARLASPPDAPRPDFEVVNLHDRHAVLLLITTLARSRHPGLDVYARLVLDEVEPAGVENFLLLCSALLATDQSAWVEFRSPSGGNGPALDPDQFAAAVTRHRLQVSERQCIASDDVPTVRMRLQPSQPEEASR